MISELCGYVEVSSLDFELGYSNTNILNNLKVDIERIYVQLTLTLSSLTSQTE